MTMRINGDLSRPVWALRSDIEASAIPAVCSFCANKEIRTAVISANGKSKKLYSLPLSSSPKEIVSLHKILIYIGVASLHTANTNNTRALFTRSTLIQLPEKNKLSFTIVYG